MRTCEGVRDPSGLIDRINEYRAAFAGTPPLMLSWSLHAAAIWKAQDIAVHYGRCEWIDSHGRDPDELAHVFGYPGDAWTSSLMACAAVEPTEALDFWLGDETAAAILRDPAQTVIGIGSAEYPYNSMLRAWFMLVGVVNDCLIDECPSGCECVWNSTGQVAMCDCPPGTAPCPGLCNCPAPPPICPSGCQCDIQGSIMHSCTCPAGTTPCPDNCRCPALPPEPSTDNTGKILFTAGIAALGLSTLYTLLRVKA